MWGTDTVCGNIREILGRIHPVTTCRQDVIRNSIRKSAVKKSYCTLKSLDNLQFSYLILYRGVVFDENEGGEMRKFIGIIAAAFCTLVTALVAPAQAAVDVPEIDPSVASSAIALLTCGWLILASKRPRK